MHAPAPPQTSTLRVTSLLALLMVLLVVGFTLSVSLGQLQVGPSDVLGTLLEQIGVHTDLAPSDPIVEQALWQIRFPRAVMSVLVGALLAVAGAVMQAIFGNPLAEPGVVGVSSGAALGAAIAIVSGLAMLGDWSAAAAGFAGGLIATFAVYATARSGGRTEVVTLLLTGIAVNAFCGAGIAITMFVGNAASREQIVFWQLGSLNGSRWSEVAVVAGVGVAGCAAAFAMARRYDLLSLGERTAGHLGVRVERLRIISIIVVALLTGTAVAFVGVIAFVGLVVPHLIRMVIGPEHRALIGGSLVGGAVLLVWADLAARSIVEQADLPIGLLTSLVGGPFFFYLIRRTRRQAGGWA